MSKLTAVGFTCGIGSMLVGARLAGFEVLGNIEWRKYYHKRDEEGRNTFEQNFPEAVMIEKFEEAKQKPYHSVFNRATVAFSHPECGNFSNLRVNKTNALHDPGDIPLSVDMFEEFRPRFFAMDDLPKSFIAYPMEKYAERLPMYDLWPEWISNYHYGNVQKNRKRMFMLGSLKSQKFTFVPGEFEHQLTVRDVLGDIVRQYGTLPNHERHVSKVQCKRANNLLKRGDSYTWAEVAKYFKDRRGGHHMPYVRADGKLSSRMSSYKAHWDAHSHVLTGGDPLFHHLTCYPYTVRERARIQGFPDDFVFYGTKMRGSRWNHEENIHMIKQTGKAMPIQFNRYFASQVRAHLEKRRFSASCERFIPPNDYISEAKSWYCENVGYSRQGAACAACWQYDVCDLSRKRLGRIT